MELGCYVMRCTGNTPQLKFTLMVENVSAEPSSVSTPQEPAAPPPSYVKLAMRNMVRKGGKSLFHFGLTVAGLLGLLVGLSYLTR